MKQAIEQAIQSAQKGSSKLSAEILQIKGQSSIKVRCFLNNLIANLGNARYLEVGVLNGATFISALYDNEFEYADAIDNFTDEGASSDNFLINTRTYLDAPNYKVKLIQDDFRNVKLSRKYNIYFYDGYHSHEAHVDAFKIFGKNFDSTFIAIIDDWNWENVRLGTAEAFDELNYNIVESWELKANGNNDVREWWNGLYVAIIKK